MFNQKKKSKRMRFFTVYKPHPKIPKPQLFSHAVLICGFKTANALACGSETAIALVCGFEMRFRNRKCLALFCFAVFKTACGSNH